MLVLLKLVYALAFAQLALKGPPPLPPMQLPNSVTKSTRDTFTISGPPLDHTGSVTFRVSDGCKVLGEDHEGFVTVPPGVTAEEILRQFSRYAREQSKRYDQLRRDFQELYRLTKTLPNEPDRI